MTMIDIFSNKDEERLKNEVNHYIKTAEDMNESIVDIKFSSSVTEAQGFPDVIFSVLVVTKRNK